MENKEKRMIMARNKINTLLNKWNSKNDINDVNFLATYNEPRLSIVDDTNHEVAISNENPRLVIMRFRQVFNANYHSRELDFNILDALDELLEEFDKVPEHYFDFNKVEDEDLQYYNENWLEYPTISVGDTVEVNKECDMEELIGKQGIVSEIHYLGTPEHDTDNMEDDFIVETTDGDILIFMEEELTLLTK